MFTVQAASQPIPSHQTVLQLPQAKVTLVCFYLFPAKLITVQRRRLGEYEVVWFSMTDKRIDSLQVVILIAFVFVVDDVF